MRIVAMDIMMHDGIQHSNKGQLESFIVSTRHIKFELDGFYIFALFENTVSLLGTIPFELSTHHICKGN